MKKHILSLAGTALMSVMTHTALAQSNVTVYGLLDMSIDASHAGNQTTYRLLSGAQTGSRLGFKGSEDLEGGNRANFVLENGFNLDNGSMSSAGVLFNRQAWIGLSGNWGEWRLGRQNSPVYVPLEGKFDASGASTIASGLNSLASISVRANNGIFYQTPTLGGFNAQFLAGLRDSTTTPRNGVNNYHIALTYLNGPVDIDGGYQQVTSATGASTLRATFVGGSYDFGVIKAYLAYHNARQSDNSINKNVYTTSASYKFTSVTSAALIYTKLHDNTAAAADADHLGFMLQHWLSKQTWIYASAAKLRNKGNASYTLAASTTAGVPLPYAGAGVAGLQIGLQKRF